MVPRDIHIRFRKSWQEVNHKNPFVRFAFENEMRGMANVVSNEKYVHSVHRVFHMKKVGSGRRNTTRKEPRAYIWLRSREKA